MKNFRLTLANPRHVHEFKADETNEDGILTHVHARFDAKRLEGSSLMVQSDYADSESDWLEYHGKRTFGLRVATSAAEVQKALGMAGGFPEIDRIMKLESELKESEAKLEELHFAYIALEASMKVCEEERDVARGQLKLTEEERDALKTQVDTIPEVKAPVT